MLANDFSFAHFHATGRTLLNSYKTHMHAHTYTQTHTCARTCTCLENPELRASNCADKIRAVNQGFKEGTNLKLKDMVYNSHTQAAQGLSHGLSRW